MRMLDICCGGGLASWGYWRSGCFSEIVGVDIDSSFRGKYGFDFECRDMLTLDYDYLSSFSFIHVSPPCQAYSKITPRRNVHKRLIPQALLMLAASGKVFAVENVEGSSRDLRPNVVMNGGYVGLESDRRRYFNVKGLEPGRYLRKVSNRPGSNVHGGLINRLELIKLMGCSVIPEKQLDRLSIHDIKQGIPPQMSMLIARLLFKSYRATIY